MLKGKVWKFKDNIDTDLIIPARYLNTSDPAELAKHCLEDADPEFVKKMSRGDILVAGENFGCGSSREHAPLAIAACGIAAVIAKSFARIFYRNALNLGLPILECPAAADEIKEGAEIQIDLEKGSIKDLVSQQEYQTKPFPEFMRELINAGGLINYVKRRLENA